MKAYTEANVLSAVGYIYAHDKRTRILRRPVRRRMVEAMLQRKDRDPSASAEDLRAVCRETVGNPFLLILIQVLIPLIVRLFLDWWNDREAA